MSFRKKNEKASGEPVLVEDTGVGTAADVEEVMKKYDRESNVRVWEGWQKLAIRWLIVAFSLYSIYFTLFGKGLREIGLTRFLAMILVI